MTDFTKLETAGIRATVIGCWEYVMHEKLEAHKDEKKMDTHLDDLGLGMDSLEKIEFIMEVEDLLDIEIPDADAEKVTTLQGAINYLVNKYIK